MARVTYGALITDISGSIGGITFHNNSSGSIARLKPKMPCNPSLLQQLQQNKLCTMVPAWQSLSLANKNAWNAFAAAHPRVNQFGASKKLNGFQWFMNCNLNLKVTSQNTISAPPAWTSISPVTQFTITATAATLLLSWTPNFDFTGYRVIVYATPPLTQSNLKLRKSTFIIKISDLGSVASVDIKAVYESIFGVTWATIFNTANCSILFRTKLVQEGTGLSSPYTGCIRKFN